MFRNRGFRQFAILFSFIAVAAVTLGFAINISAGILAITAAAAFGITFYVFTKARYKSIARISEEIDLVLHNTDHLFMSESDEGELSILQSEITKMTIQIREQNDTLRKEKEHLAESLANIAHQLRTPLTSANLILSLLKKNPDENERQALLRENEELFAQMDWLVTSLLKLSRLDAGIVMFQNKRIEPDALIDAAVHPLLIPMELHDIALQINVPKGIIIQGDFGWLSEAIQNLLKNCMESAGNHGKIVIFCEDNPLFTEITLHDSGAGFKKEELSHLFDRFYRGKNAGATGYGIGLALCKSIITRQNGTILAKNHPQGGALFMIRFPK